MPNIHIVFGPLGAGKTTYAQKLSVDENAVCFSVDQWMVNLFGPDMPTSPNFEWVVERVKRCEHLIWLTAKAVASNGSDVVLDLGFMKVASRVEFVALANQAGIHVKTHFIHASSETRRVRVIERNKNKGDTFAFHVSPNIFDFMESQFETAPQDELLGSVVIDTDKNAAPT